MGSDAKRVEKTPYVDCRGVITARLFSRRNRENTSLAAASGAPRRLMSSCCTSHGVTGCSLRAKITSGANTPGERK